MTDTAQGSRTAAARTRAPAAAPRRAAGTAPAQHATPQALQLRCACGNKAAAGGSCEECARRRPEPQRAARPDGPRGGGAAIGGEAVPASGGRPLDAATRRFFERRFGHGFGDVRVHDDGRAAAAARGLDALAYASGRDIVFGAGRYRPASPEGLRLLAHELTHVVQQRAGLAPARAGRSDDPAEREAERNAKRLHTGEPMRFDARAPALARQAAGETTVSVQAPTGPPGCTLEQHRVIEPAVRTALEQLRVASDRLQAYLGAPASHANRPVHEALDRHFHDTGVRVGRLVLARLEGIRRDITSRHPFTVECHGTAADCTDISAAAYVRRSQNLLVFCASFFGVDATRQPGMLIHEMAHALSGLTITDRAYRHERVLRFLSPAEALDNAESYAMFTTELATGQRVSGNPPEDEVEGCTPETRQRVDEAIGRAERWNGIAQLWLADTQPANVSHVSTLLRTHLGRDNPATRDAAKAAINTTFRRLNSPIDVRCDTRAAPACSSRLAYGAAAVDNRGRGAGIGAAIGGGAGLVGGLVAGLVTGALGVGLGVGLGLLALGALVGLIVGAATSHGPSVHVCPAWSQQASIEDRTESMLAALYETYGGLDAVAARRHAALARALNPRII